MKIVIAGVGAIGFHLAKLLADQNNDITVIDNNRDELLHADRHLDVLTIYGDAATLSVLEQANIKKAQLFIALTTSEKTNLLSCILAKQLGAKNTIARISDVEYLKDQNKSKLADIGIDVLISPHQLASFEIERLIKRASFTDLFEFEGGKISVVGFTLDATSPLIHHTIDQIRQLAQGLPFKGIALLRENETIIPTPNTILLKGDHFYISVLKESLDRAIKFIGMQLKPIKKIMILGGTPMAYRTAKQLENQYHVSIVLEDEDRGKEILEGLNKSLVVHANPGDIDALKEEGLEQMDAFIALTPNSETNIITSLMAEQLGVYKTIALVENVNYTHISQHIGIDTIINKKLIAASNIFRFVRKGKIAAIAGLHGVNGEIIEFVIHKRNRIVKRTISDLRLPAQSIIAGVVRGEESFLPDADFKLQIDDKIIVFALRDCIHKVEEIFK